MSYDITFLPKPPGQSWAEVLKACEERALGQETPAPIDPDGRRKFARIADAVRRILPDAEIFEGSGYIEPIDDATGIQVAFFAGEAAVSIPFWHKGKQARSVMAVVRTIARIVERETGWPAYDAQQDRPFLVPGGEESAARDMDLVFDLLHGKGFGRAKRPWWRYW
ncbi:MAG: hypothetical protein JXP34_28580 [Planctomycetes bacterium]|nr:hypothetical protein [Planctomycetota bacterium]